MHRAGRMSVGFTLIELMIVVAIIAIIAAIAIPNLLRSRMAANESSAIASCKTYASAQSIYLRTDYDGDAVLEYATSVDGPSGLYTNNVATPGDLALVDQSFANATGDPTGGAAEALAPKAGYVFRILTGQSANAPGGAFSYMAQGNMTVGFGLSAAAYNYDGTGRNTFQINYTGTVFQNDRGPTDTTHLTVYDPGTGWVVSE